MPFGKMLIALGLQHFVKAFKEKYKQNIRYMQTAQRLDPMLKLGLIAHGIVVALVRTFFIWAAWTADPSRAGGMRDALLVLSQRRFVSFLARRRPICKHSRRALEIY